MKPNIPLDRLSVPMPRVGDEDRYGPASSVLRPWIQRTFAVGTPVKISGSWYPSQRSTHMIAPGARAVVVGAPEVGTGPDDGPWVVPVEIVDARDAVGMPVREAVGSLIREPYDMLEPLVDNWASQGGISIPRYRLPNPQRSRLKPNPVPSPPQNPMHHWDWFRRTYPVGATVMWRQDQYLEPFGLTVPAGIKAVVVELRPPGDAQCPNGCAVLRFLPVLTGASDPRIERFAADSEQLVLDHTGEHHRFDSMEAGLEPSDAVSGIVSPLGDTWAMIPNRRRTSRAKTHRRRRRTSRASRRTSRRAKRRTSRSR